MAHKWKQYVKFYGIMINQYNGNDNFYIPKLIDDILQLLFLLKDILCGLGLFISCYLAKVTISLAGYIILFEKNKKSLNLFYDEFYLRLKIFKSKGNYLQKFLKRIFAYFKYLKIYVVGLFFINEYPSKYERGIYHLIVNLLHCVPKSPLPSNKINFHILIVIYTRPSMLGSWSNKLSSSILAVFSVRWWDGHSYLWWMQKKAQKDMKALCDPYRPLGRSNLLSTGVQFPPFTNHSMASHLTCVAQCSQEIFSTNTKKIFQQRFSATLTVSDSVFTVEIELQLAITSDPRVLRSCCPRLFKTFLYLTHWVSYNTKTGLNYFNIFTHICNPWLNQNSSAWKTNTAHLKYFKYFVSLIQLTFFIYPFMIDQVCHICIKILLTKFFILGSRRSLTLTGQAPKMDLLTFSQLLTRTNQ
ncbi:hypothetical protein VP01_1207g2 [Puccinia sorghi]|uniref:Uncharacterized protein n=1 Tax=Puccinia sorghi TaxID=27349 RepID=A0A0L6VQF8_9BASI|nr:hypothetical protein VP01_1207g2 [Puccinia sorghi]